MKVVHTFADARVASSGTVALVPTMGFFHEGHLELIRRAAGEGDTVVVSLFVNPTQFGPGEDLGRYPRDLERDADLAEAEGVDVLFAPGLDEMYPAPPSVDILVPAIAERMEGVVRPGHFAGVALAVIKLLAGLQPGVAFFGRKDAQQLALVRRLVRDLAFPVRIEGVPTVRQQDGIALSSRNIFLEGERRRAAGAISRGLFAAADLVEQGERDGPALEQAAAAVIDAEPLLERQYVELADAADVVRLHRLDRPAFLAAAATLGDVRLIDNVYFPAPDLEPDRGIRLEGPSLLEG